MTIWSRNRFVASPKPSPDRPKVAPASTSADAYDIDQIPATSETIDAMPRLLRHEIKMRQRGGAPELSELAARCLLNEANREKKST